MFSAEKTGNRISVDFSVQGLTKKKARHTYILLFPGMSRHLVHQFAVIAITYIWEILDINPHLLSSLLCRDFQDGRRASFWSCLVAAFIFMSRSYSTQLLCCRKLSRQISIKCRDFSRHNAVFYHYVVNSPDNNKFFYGKIFDSKNFVSIFISTEKREKQIGNSNSNWAFPDPPSGAIRGEHR